MHAYYIDEKVMHASQIKSGKFNNSPIKKLIIGNKKQ